MGAEGPTDDPEIIAARERQKRNFLATLFLSQGTPMLLGGDEMGRTQGGNNNAWCQDNEISWFDWEVDEAGERLLDFSRRLIALRRRHPVFRRRQFLHGTEQEGSGLPDAWWFRPDGRRMTKRDWQDSHVVGMFFNGEEIAPPDEQGRPVVDDSFLLLFNGSLEALDFRLPPTRFGRRWTVDPAHRRPRRRAGRGARERGRAPVAAPAVPHGAAARELTAFRATYRLQLGPGFGFAAARELVPYLRDLGVSHVYLPPSFQARPGSEHGYDVVDPTRLSDELGGEREFDALAAAARRAGLGLILDIVPNHMATDDANRWWADPALRSRFFDIDERTGRWRRFFDIDHLAAVRQEDAQVFEETHRLALRLVREGTVDGLRVDHPDGLADPAGYLRRLRDAGARHVWVEKILTNSHPPEPLRDWPVEGTVGYEFLNDVAALFVDPAGEVPLTELWGELAGDDRPFGEVALEAKLEQVRGPFAPEVDRLRREAPREVGGLERTLASLPVYRTYVEPWSGLVEEADRLAIREAGLPESLERVLTLRERGWDGFVTRFQQTTPAIMAKGVEDTAFYRYARLLALNDVGGDPSRFGLSVEEFHRANLERAERFPLNLLITQTHDTKRSGDVRARIGALAGMADEWAAHVRRWLEACSTIAGPDAVERYLIFQTLVGAWPLEVERLEAYVEKAMREAKRNTNWIEPDLRRTRSA